MNQIKAVVMAAGQGTRMKSKHPKVTHKIIDKPIIEYVLKAARGANAKELCVIVGYEAEKVKAVVGEEVEYVYQHEQKGTGHAVMQAKDFIGTDGHVLILNGDAPMITAMSLHTLISEHLSKGNTATVLSAVIDDSTNYGLIIREHDGTFIKNVEYKDATEDEKLSQEINAGIYIFEANALQNALSHLTNDNAQGEYYLPDCLTILREQGQKVEAMPIRESNEVLGINSRIQLAEITKIMQKRINDFWMSEGVTMLNPEATFIGMDVTIGQDVILYPNTYLFNQTVIEEDAMIGENSEIDNSLIGKGAIIGQSTVIDSQVAAGTKLGPYEVLIDNEFVDNSKSH